MEGPVPSSQSSHPGHSCLLGVVLQGDPLPLFTRDLSLDPLGTGTLSGGRERDEVLIPRVRLTYEELPSLTPKK